MSDQSIHRNRTPNGLTADQQREELMRRSRIFGGCRACRARPGHWTGTNFLCDTCEQVES